jgi:hypothetical protein
MYHPGRVRIAGSGKGSAVADVDQLGALIREFRTDTRRRRRTGAVLTALGLVLVLLAVAGLVGALITPGLHAVGPLGLPGAVGFLAIGWGRMLLRVSRSETLELREGGLVQRTEQGDRVLTWDDIPFAEYRSPPPTGTYTPGRIMRRIGMDVHVLVWPVTGRHIRITGHTAGAADLVVALRARIPHGESPANLRYALLFLIAVAVFIVAAIAIVVAVAIWGE